MQAVSQATISTTKCPICKIKFSKKKLSPHTLKCKHMICAGCLPNITKGAIAACPLGCKPAVITPIKRNQEPIIRHAFIHMIFSNFK